MNDCTPEVINSLENQFYILPWPYHSRIKFVANRAVSRTGTGFEYVVPAGTTLSAFSYAIGEVGEAAGYTAADGIATPNMTNIESARETIAGDRVLIQGIALIPLPAAQHRAAAADAFVRTRLADAVFLAALISSLSVDVTLNGGRNRFRAGMPLMIPGNGGLLGGAVDNVHTRPFNGPQPQQQFAANGWPTISNYYPLPQGLVWNPTGKAQSLLAVNFVVDRLIELQSGTYEVPEANIAGDNAPANVATGVQQYTFPTELVQEFQVVLVGLTDGPRGEAI